ncbi:unnamed protein product [Ophioblennius macclurei]
MHQRRHPEHLEGPTPQGAQIPGKIQDRILRRSRTRRESTAYCCAMGRAPLWAWLLLGALVVPGAWSFLSEEQEELLVELHNYYRGQVSPSASAMLPLKWDPSLKVIAEGYAATCVWNHNPDLEDTGENLFAGTGQLDLRVAMEKWFLEHLDYNFGNNSCDEDKMCGHYTQMVWADTHRVGCAFHLCNNMEGLDWERVSFLVCNYYPAGNYEDERPYVEGDWCSRCPDDMQKCENNLCVTDTEEEGDDDEEEEEEEEKEEDKSDEEEQEAGTAVPPVHTPTFLSIDVDVLTAQPDTTPSDSPISRVIGPDDMPPQATYGPEEPSTTEEAEEEVEEVEEVKREQAATKEKETKDQRMKPPAVLSAASVFLSSILVVCVTAVLTVRL